MFSLLCASITRLYSRNHVHHVAVLDVFVAALFSLVCAVLLGIVTMWMGDCLTTIHFLLVYAVSRDSN